jgi:Uma2 family endonuclease
MATIPKPQTTPRTRPQDEGLPPLEAGDHLDQKTFHARYEAMPEHVRAELVQGVVIMPSPLRSPHGHIHAELVTWLTLFKGATPGTDVLDNATTMLSDENEVQPDGQLLILPHCGGQTHDAGGYIVGAPELVAEVASTSASYDLHTKRAAYEQAGVREYVVIVVREPQVLWFVRHEDRFAPLAPGPDGIFRSPGFPGLWLDPQALLNCETTRVIDVLRQGLASAEHAAFVERLKPAAPPA